MLASLKNAARKFHNDERGMETLQIVMIVGIAAIILIIMWQFFPGIRTWLSDQIKKVTDRDTKKDATTGETVV